SGLQFSTPRKMTRTTSVSADVVASAAVTPLAAGGIATATAAVVPGGWRLDVGVKRSSRRPVGDDWRRVSARARASADVGGGARGVEGLDAAGMGVATLLAPAPTEEHSCSTLSAGSLASALCWARDRAPIDP
ncbi:hypothetical protein Vretifemale_5837, partial [Volvox reticuliferus]